jgi:hypothetical protein
MPSGAVPFIEGIYDHRSFADILPCRNSGAGRRAGLGCRNNRRNRADDPISEAAMRDEYENPSSYNPEKFWAKLHPRH